MEETLPTARAHRKRYRHVRLAHQLRRPLAIASLAAGLFGILINALDLSIYVGPGGVSLGTHPMTALLIVMLSVGLLHYRIGQATPSWRYVIGSIALGMTLFNLVQPDMVYNAFLPWSATADSRMGQDTSVMLAILFSSVIVRRRFGRVGMGLALTAVILLCFSFMGHSYDVHYLDGQMALTTMIALVPATFAVLSLYAHYPTLRPLLVSDENGMRTRMMVMIGFVVPWLGGIALYHGFGVPERDFPAEAIVLSAVVCSMICTSVYSGITHERSDRLRRLAERRLAFAALHDQLTGILNRAGINEVLGRSWARFRRSGHTAAVVLMDLDHFKSINDTYGHPAGDSVLAAVKSALAPNLRHSDVIGRWGGEEFVILLDGADKAAIEAICERLRQAMKRLPTFIAREDGEGIVPFAVSASFGASVFHASDRGFSDALRRADLALYDAKAGGRDRVMLRLDEDQSTAA